MRVGCVLLASACGRAEAPLPATPPPAVRDPAPSDHPVTTAAASSARPTGDLELRFTDPSLLRDLEALGLDLGRVLGESEARRLDELRRVTAFDHIARTLERDLAEIAARDPKSGVGIRGHAHRRFDERWLRSPDANFTLVAVVARPDRRPFHARACGEVRLVYRLAYATKVRDREQQSRLPMTINVELRADDDVAGDCSEAIARFEAPRGGWTAELLRAAEGPLAPPRIGIDRIAQVTVNLQTVRWPSGVRPDLGGHAEYLLRAFVRRSSDGGFEPGPLENTPDAERIKRDARLRASLLAWLRDPDNLRRLDEGTATIPEAFLTRRAVSVTPRGLGRRANRPFATLLTDGDLADLDLAGFERIGSVAALRRRLDDLSCPGCHQSRSLAGFHLLGEDGSDVLPGNALASGISPHLAGDEARRTRIADALRRHDAVDFSRPFAERPGSDGRYGAPCGLGDPGFRSWTCDPGYACKPLDLAESEREEVGVCLPTEVEVGDPCEVAWLVPNDDPHRDRAPRATLSSCGPSMVCNTNAVGFPNGMCTAGCASGLPRARCGSIALLAPFNACLARGAPMAECLTHVRPAGLRACDAVTPCRNDYLCARTDGDRGVCIPPYFLMQLRVDGHP